MRVRHTTNRSAPGRAVTGLERLRLAGSLAFRTGTLNPMSSMQSSPPAQASDEQLAGELPQLPADPRYARFIVDLFGVMAYGELSGFERLSSDARFSPTLHDRAALGRLAVVEFEHFEMVSAHLAALGVDVETAMTPFQPSIDSFHERTRPADWYESLMKAYVIDAISDDFYTALAGRLDAPTRELIGRIQSADEQGALLQERLRAALADDPRLASRLALWGRRLVGEALTQAQRIGIERAFLGALLFAGAEEDQEKETLLLFSQLTRNHSRRMSLLGLTA
ncbi:ferritin-like fold-containing protein [Arthrobacter sp. TMN-50]